MRSTAVVVTFNRRDLLQQCLAALAAQTHPLTHVLVVDNASTDGTAEMIRREYEWAELIALPENRGGAGGFHAGLKAAMERAPEWVWLLDDDTIPRPDALERLLGLARPAGLPAASVLASRVEWRDGRAHPMNLPIVKRRDMEHLVACAQARIVPLRTATFVSLLVASDAVRRHGLPLQEYFLWADDIEYTARVLRHEHGYLVPTSVVEHRTKTPHTALSHSRERFYFFVRNTLFLIRSPAWERAERPAIWWSLVGATLAFLRINRCSPASFAVVARGLRDGLRSRPRPELVG